MRYLGYEHTHSKHQSKHPSHCQGLRRTGHRIRLLGTYDQIPRQTNNQIKHGPHVCVLPLTSTSTSICLAMALKLSKSPVGIHWCPWTTPIRIGVCVTVALKGKFEVYTANQHPSIPLSSTHLLHRSPPARQLHRQPRS